MKHLLTLSIFALSTYSSATFTMDKKLQETFALYHVLLLNQLSEVLTEQSEITEGSEVVEEQPNTTIVPLKEQTTPLNKKTTRKQYTQSSKTYCIGKTNNNKKRNMRY